MRRETALLALLALALVALPAVANPYLLSVATLVLYLAYTGQAWNVMMGFAGQLSLGHALYTGLGAYVSAALFFHYGIGPWAGVWLAIAACVALGCTIGFLAFRFGISGVYFALLTIAFAEFTRIGFDHLAWVGGPGGLFLKVAQRDQVEIFSPREIAVDREINHEIRTGQKIERQCEKIERERYRRKTRSRAQRGAERQRASLRRRRKIAYFDGICDLVEKKRDDDQRDHRDQQNAARHDAEPAKDLDAGAQPAAPGLGKMGKRPIEHTTQHGEPAHGQRERAREHAAQPGIDQRAQGAADGINHCTAPSIAGLDQVLILRGC